MGIKEMDLQWQAWLQKVRDVDSVGLLVGWVYAQARCLEGLDDG